MLLIMNFKFAEDCSLATYYENADARGGVATAAALTSRLHPAINSADRNAAATWRCVGRKASYRIVIPSLKTSR